MIPNMQFGSFVWENIYRIAFTTFREMELKDENGEQVVTVEKVIPLMNSNEEKTARVAYMATCFVLFYIIDCMKEALSVGITAKDMFVLHVMTASGFDHNMYWNGRPLTETIKANFKRLWDAKKTKFKKYIRRNTKIYPLITCPPECRVGRDRTKSTFYLYRNGGGRKGPFHSMVSWGREYNSLSSETYTFGF